MPLALSLLLPLPLSLQPSRPDRAFADLCHPRKHQQKLVEVAANQNDSIQTAVDGRPILADRSIRPIIADRSVVVLNTRRTSVRLSSPPAGGRRRRGCPAAVQPTGLGSGDPRRESGRVFKFHVSWCSSSICAVGNEKNTRSLCLRWGGKRARMYVYIGQLVSKVFASIFRNCTHKHTHSRYAFA